jgi:hypothetical protein
MASQKNMDLPSFIKGIAVGATAGIASLIVYQYLNTILKQPRLISRAVLSKAEDFDTVEAHALFIAADNLRSAIEARHMSNRKTRELLHAGYRNFRESWARDFSFASYGLLALKEFKVVKDTWKPSSIIRLLKDSSRSNYIPWACPDPLYAFSSRKRTVH